MLQAVFSQILWGCCDGNCDFSSFFPKNDGQSRSKTHSEPLRQCKGSYKTVGFNTAWKIKSLKWKMDVQQIHKTDSKTKKALAEHLDLKLDTQEGALLGHSRSTFIWNYKNMIYDRFPCKTIFNWIVLWVFSARLDYQTELDCVALRFSQEKRLRHKMFMHILDANRIKILGLVQIYSSLQQIKSCTEAPIRGRPSDVSESNVMTGDACNVSTKTIHCQGCIGWTCSSEKKHSDCTLCTNKENLRESLQHMCQGFLPKCAPDSATPKRGIDLQWSRLAMVFSIKKMRKYE